MKTTFLLIATMTLLPCLPAAAEDKKHPAQPPAEAVAKPAARPATNTQKPENVSLKDALPGKKSDKLSSKKKAIQLNLCDQ